MGNVYILLVPAHLDVLNNGHCYIISTIDLY